MRLGHSSEAKPIQIRWWNMVHQQHWMTSTELILICFSPEILAKSQNLICFHVKGMMSGHPQPPSLKVTLTSRLKWEQEQWPWTRLFIKETKHLKKKTFEEKNIWRKNIWRKKHQSNGREQGFSLTRQKHLKKKHLKKKHLKKKIWRKKHQSNGREQGFSLRRQKQLKKKHLKKKTSEQWHSERGFSLIKETQTYEEKKL